MLERQESWAREMRIGKKDGTVSEYRNLIKHKHIPLLKLFYNDTWNKGNLQPLRRNRMELASFVNTVCDRELPEDAHIPNLVWNLCMLNGMAAGYLMNVCQHELTKSAFDEEMATDMVGEMLIRYTPLAVHICKEKGLDITGYLDGWEEKSQIKEHESLGTMGVAVELCAQVGGALGDLQIGVFDYRKFNKIWDGIRQLAALHGMTTATVADIALAQEVFVGDAKPVTH